MEFRNVGRQTNASKPCGDSRPEFFDGAILDRDSLPQDIPHFVFHAPSMLPRSTLQPGLDVILQVTHDELSHEAPSAINDITISIHRFATEIPM